MEATDISIVTASLESQDLTSAIHDKCREKLAEATRLQDQAIRLNASFLLSRIQEQREQERAKDKEEYAALFARQLQEVEKASAQRHIELRSEMEGIEKAAEEAAEKAKREQEMRDMEVIERLEKAKREQEMRDIEVIERLEKAKREQEMRDMEVIKRLEKAKRDQEKQHLKWEHKSLSAKAYNELRAEQEKLQLDFTQFKMVCEQLKATVHRQVEHMVMLSEHKKSKVAEALDCMRLRNLIDQVQAKLALVAGLVSETYDPKASSIWRAHLTGDEALNRSDRERLAIAKGLFTGSTGDKVSALHLLNSPAGYLVVRRFSLLRKKGDLVAHGPINREGIQPAVDRLDSQAKDDILLLVSFICDYD